MKNVKGNAHAKHLVNVCQYIAQFVGLMERHMIILVLQDVKMWKDNVKVNVLVQF